MKQPIYTQQKNAAKVMILLAAIFISACTNNPVSSSRFQVPGSESSIPPSPNPPISQSTITLSTYPIKEHLTGQINPLYNIPLFSFDHPAFDKAQLPPTPIDYTGIVLKNPYLRLTSLPELGERLYSAVIKAINQEVFYHNPVVKTSHYGILQPYQANGWLAQPGGLTWANEQVSSHLNTHDAGDTNPHTLTALVSQPTQGNIIISTGDTLLLTKPFSANPDTPLSWNFPTAAETLKMQIADNNGNLYLEYQIKP